MLAEVVLGSNGNQILKLHISGFNSTSLSDELGKRDRLSCCSFPIYLSMACMTCCV